MILGNYSIKTLVIIALFTLAACADNKYEITEKKKKINTQINTLYEEYTRLSDSEMHITRPLKIPADTIHYFDSLSTITDPALEKMEIDIWVKIRALQDTYYQLGEEDNSK